jgi:sarcosine oxidase subunit alpha
MTDRLPLPFGRLIDRTKPLSFTFEGIAYQGFAGDTIASALVGAGRWTLSRSFKYHRPRGPLSMAGQDANSIVQVPGEPNAYADRVALTSGVKVQGLNYFGSIDRDTGRVMELFSRFLPVGFYYKTFYKPKWLWPFWEKVIRRMAGLGHVEKVDGHPYFDKAYAFCDVAVIGGGPAGLAAALAAAEAGAEVALIDEQPILGGALAYARFDIGGLKAESVSADLVARVRAEKRITVYQESVCQGWFADHFLPVTKGNRLYKLRAKATVVATGAMEQPLVFRANDLPGIMLGSAAQRLMRLYGVKPGKRAVVATANDDGYAVALDLIQAGVQVALVVDLRKSPTGPARDAVRAAGITIRDHATLSEAIESANRVSAVQVSEIAGEGALGRDLETVSCDLVCLSIGYAPSSALLHHAGAKLAYDPATAMTQVLSLPSGLYAAGSVGGYVWDLDAVLADGRHVGAAAAANLGFATSVPPAPETDAGIAGITHPWPIFPHPKGKEFVDFDEDLQIKDIVDAAAEGYDHIQLLKRYSTAGMGPSQGRMANVAVIRLLAKATGASIHDVGTTTIRPPIGPEKIGHMAGRSFSPIRLTSMHERHLALGAVMMPAGDWMRPARYGQDESVIAEEATAVRKGLGIIDVSTLGGIEVRGPDAAELLNRMYTGAYAKQPVGHGRYLLMTDVAGIVIDDGVAARIGEQHFYVTATTGGVDRVYRSMQWFNAQWRLAVDVAHVTAAYAAVNLAGPLSRQVLQGLSGTIDWSAEAFPYMGVREGDLAGIPVRAMRVGFVGELGYEIHVPASYGAALWDVLMAAGKPHGIRPFGVEAQRLLRLEKGHIIVSQDTDGITNPLEAGMAWAIAGKKGFYVGKQAVDAAAAAGPTRRLVGFEIAAGDLAKVKECHLVVRDREITGRVTSIAWSPALEKVIGLAYVAPDQVEAGSRFTIKGEGGAIVTATTVRTPFYDPENKRQAL